MFKQIIQEIKSKEEAKYYQEALLCFANFKHRHPSDFLWIESNSALTWEVLVNYTNFRNLWKLKAKATRK